MFNFEDTVLKLMVCAGVFAALASIVLAITSIQSEVPQDDRAYMDPLPRLLRLIWPLVNIFSYYIGERLSVDYLIKVGKGLQHSGVAYLMTPEQYIGLRLTSLVLGALVATVLLLLLQALSLTGVLVGAVVGVFLPSLSLRDLKAKREKELVKSLPVYLDFLTMAVQAGMNMTGAIHQAVDKGPAGPLRVEFKKVLRDIKAGMSRRDALRELAARNELKELNAFATSVVQAEKTGASIGNTLKIQSDQRRVERFQRAEKLAMEAPVKLVFPLVAFIFPMTFLVLFFPIVMKFVHDL